MFNTLSLSQSRNILSVTEEKNISSDTGWSKPRLAPSLSVYEPERAIGESENCGEPNRSVQTWTTSRYILLKRTLMQYSWLTHVAPKILLHVGLFRRCYTVSRTVWWHSLLFWRSNPYVLFRLPTRDICSGKPFMGLMTPLEALKMIFDLLKSESEFNMLVFLLLIHFGENSYTRRLYFKRTILHQDIESRNMLHTEKEGSIRPNYEDTRSNMSTWATGRKKHPFFWHNRSRQLQVVLVCPDKRVQVLRTGQVMDSLEIFCNINLINQTFFSPLTWIQIWSRCPAVTWIFPTPIGRQCRQMPVWQTRNSSHSLKQFGSNKA